MEETEPLEKSKHGLWLIVTNIDNPIDVTHIEVRSMSHAVDKVHEWQRSNPNHPVRFQTMTDEENHQLLVTNKSKNHV